MNWKISLVILLVVSACKREKATTTDIEPDATITSKIDYLIEANELLSIVNKPNIKIIDFRKAEYYEKEHIEGALNIWRTDIEDHTYPYKGMMAGKQQMETLFSDLGIKTDDTLVIYDDNALCDSARLWWVLQNYDFTNVKLLHGGIPAWKANNGKVSIEKPVVKKATFKLVENPSMRYYISRQDVLLELKSNTLLLDTRTLDEFTGKRQKKGAAKGGRLPNSKLIDWVDTVNYNDDKRIKSIAELNSIYNNLNSSKYDAIIVYCHSGVRSAYTTFVLTQLLNYKNVKNYDGSWTEWSHFYDSPIERDSTTIIYK